MKNLILLITVLFVFSCKENTITEAIVNEPPVIISVTAPYTTLETDHHVRLTCHFTEPEDEYVTFRWSSQAGTFTDDRLNRPAVNWKAPSIAGRYTVFVTIIDEHDNEDTGSITLEVVYGPPSTEEIMIYASDDATVSSEYPDQNYGDELSLGIGGSLNYGKQAYIKFPIPATVWPDMDIAKVTLMVIIGPTVGTDPVGWLQCHSVSDQSWGEGSITWNNKPAYSSLVIAYIQDQVFGEYSLAKLDITEYFKEHFTDNFTMSLVVRAIGLNSSLDESRAYLYSTEAASRDGLPYYSPRLKIEYYD